MKTEDTTVFLSIHTQLKFLPEEGSDALCCPAIDCAL